MIAGDARADDVADAEQLGRQLAAEHAPCRPASVRRRVQRQVRRSLVQSLHAFIRNLWTNAMPKPTNTVLADGAALLAGDQHLGAGGAFGVACSCCRAA